MSSTGPLSVEKTYLVYSLNVSLKVKKKSRNNLISIIHHIYGIFKENELFLATACEV